MALKISLKIGGRVKLKKSEVLPVTLAIYDQDGQIEELVSFLSPLPEPLERKFKEWQYFIGLQGNRRVVKNTENPSSRVVNFTELTNSLKAELNRWLGSDGWSDENGTPDLRVSQVLENYRKKNTAEVQIIVQTEDRQLRGLPWQEWDTLKGYTSKGVEVAISATNFRRINRRQVPQIKPSVRILVVFGDQGLGFAEEKDLIERLEQYGGEHRILEQPSREKLEKELKDPQGWHIFFFAGHSKSDPDGQIGSFQINLSDGEQGVIEIAELKELLEDAIQKKLQLAIFNSCDGLGLANQLTKLSLPYCIVMREMVDSSVARELLKHFLTAFVKDHSLFASMNAARQQLEKNFEPGKSWLPVIVANPLAQELTWNRLFSERRLSWQWEMGLGTIMLAILVGLPISIWNEFQGQRSLTLYAQLYPQITVYPSLILWMPLYSAYRCLCMVRVKTRLFVILILANIVFTLGASFIESHGDRIMFMELKPDATTTIYKSQLTELSRKLSTSAELVKKIPDDIFKSHKAFDTAGDLTLKQSELESAIKAYIDSHQKIKNQAEFQGLMRIAASYEVWHQNRNVFSISKLFYVLNFAAIVSCTLQIFVFISTILFKPDSIFNKNKYLTYLIACELGILLWVPFEKYTIEQTKEVLFSQEFKGVFAEMNVMIYIIIFLLFWATITSIFRSAAQKYQISLLLFLFVSLALALVGSSSIFGVFLIDQVFGMSSNNPLTPWFVNVCFLPFLFVLLILRIDFRAGDECGR